MSANFGDGSLPNLAKGPVSGLPPCGVRGSLSSSLETDKAFSAAEAGGGGEGGVRTMK